MLRGVDHRRQAWASRCASSKIIAHTRVCFPHFAILENNTASTVVANLTKRGDDSIAIGYGNLLRCPCRSLFSSPIGRELITQSQSASRIDQKVLADKHNPSVRHISPSIRLDAFLPSFETEPQSGHQT